MIETLELLKPIEELKNCTMVTGFPGFGLVGTITTEFLLSHLKCECIGGIVTEKLNPVVAIHGKELIRPIGLFYNKKFNILILHIITDTKGIEWEISDMILDLAKKIKAKQIISFEGVAKQNEEKNENNIFYYANKPAYKKELDSLKIKPLDEGIIFGATACLMIKLANQKKGIGFSSFFCEATMKYPDSKAAAKVIETLDKYLKLDVDYKPLLVKAQILEKKLQTILSKSKEVVSQQQEQNLNYFG